MALHNEKNISDLLKGTQKTLWGSHNSDMSAGTIKKHERSADFTGKAGPGGDIQAFPSGGDGLHSPTLPGAVDDTLIKEYSK